MNKFLPHKGATDFFKTSDGVSIRYGVFPAEGMAIGTILLINGHREFIEKYKEFIEDFQKRGFHVFTMDHRGQGLSGRMLTNPRKSHNPDFGRIVMDIQEFTEDIVRPAELGLPVFLVSHSLGSHLALRFLHDYPGVVDKAVLLSPFTDMGHGGFFKRFFAKLFFKIMYFLGMSRIFAVGQARRKSMIDHNHAFERLTHDQERYDHSQEAIKHNPDLFVGGVTYGWLKGAMNSIKKIKSSGFMEKIKTPCLFILSGDEKVVNNQTTFKLIAKMNNVKVTTIEGARHELYRESDEYRNQMWTVIDRFLYGRIQ
ncbi:alpha/beta fold hydrolase [Pseudemcibacter aquimaris]|uniref:alpha/beta fold hydrolase n=1 Tax=Pseudemcibacter aquimaris TaxID=2857064 RepID=UPI002012DE62|nr:alpha/beta hydrolase [Pseudemcibacter aquimaris]MCC3860164.1 alpha/beta hydrolase [Pseudemcibacter aquimaris]WDU57491.1 alpha/beta hydrolase [Pseudemcibacter aquimaris]